MKKKTRYTLKAKIAFGGYEKGEEIFTSASKNDVGITKKDIAISHVPSHYYEAFDYGEVRKLYKGLYIVEKESIPIEYIICSAIWFDTGEKYPHNPKGMPSGLFISGRRHHNCYATLSALNQTHLKKNYSIQGFMTSFDNFVSREAAYKIALEAGQLAGRAIQKRGFLHSEDLY